MDLMNTRAMRELCQSFRQPRPPIFVHGVNRVPRTALGHHRHSTILGPSIIWRARVVCFRGGSGIRSPLHEAALQKQKPGFE